MMDMPEKKHKATLSVSEKVWQEFISYVVATRGLRKISEEVETALQEYLEKRKGNN